MHSKHGVCLIKHLQQRMISKGKFSLVATSWVELES